MTTTKQAAFLARLRDKGLGLAPHVADGKIVRPKRSSKQPASGGVLPGYTPPNSISGPITPPRTVRPAERHTRPQPGQTFELVIPAPCPFLNANRDKSLHWAEKGRRVKAWRDAGRAAAERAGLPQGLERVQIDAYVVKPIANRFDPANWSPTSKATTDGMVTDYGLCADDDRHHVTGPFMHDGGKGSNALRIVVTVLTTS